MDEAVVAVKKAVDLNGTLGLPDDGLHDAAHGSVQGLAVSSAGQQSDPEHGASSPLGAGVWRRVAVHLILAQLSDHAAVDSPCICKWLLEVR